MEEQLPSTIYLTVTEIGKSLVPPISAKYINEILEAHGLQERVDGEWKPTKKGIFYATIRDTGRKHKTDGRAIYQIKWSTDVVSIIS